MCCNDRTITFANAYQPISLTNTHRQCKFANWTRSGGDLHCNMLKTLKNMTINKITYVGADLRRHIFGSKTDYGHIQLMRQIALTPPHNLQI